MGPNQRCYFVKFNGNPWGSYDENQRLHARMIIQNLINQLKMVGWSVLISADVSSKLQEEYKIDCDSIFLSKTSDSFFTENMQFMPDPPSYLEAFTGNYK